MDVGAGVEDGRVVDDLQISRLQDAGQMEFRVLRQRRYRPSRMDGPKFSAYGTIRSEGTPPPGEAEGKANIGGGTLL